MKSLLAITTALFSVFSAVLAVQNTTQQFYLKTNLLSPRWQRERFDNLYVYSYHTGAGLSDAALSPAIIPNGNGRAFLNSTSTKDKKNNNLIFNLSADFPWGLALTNDYQYNQWASVTINAGTGQSGWYANRTSGRAVLNYIEKERFGGWMVCDWAHGVPQLFWRVAWSSGNLPRSCGNVELELEYF